MTTIALSKTWDIDPNNVGGTGVTSTEDHQRTLFQIKEALVGNGSGELSNPMTVISSSDSVTADATDNWAAHTDLVWSATTRSWIVLEMGDGGAQILFDLNSSFERLLTPMWSPAAGFTGGTTGARPTATDEQPINGTETVVGWLGQNSSTGTYISHVWGSTDGASYRVATYFTSKSCASWMMFEKVKNPVPSSGPAWNEYVMQMTYPSGATGHCLRANDLMDQLMIRVEYDGSAFDCRLSGEATGVSGNNVDLVYTQRSIDAEVAAPNALSGVWDLTPVGVFCDDIDLRGRLGELNDVWFVPTDSGPPNLFGRNDGDFFPESDDADGARQVVVLGDIALPWGLAVDMRLGYVGDP